MQVRHLLTYLISLPKTIFFNFRCLPINQAIHLPIFVAYNVKLLNLKKNVISIETVVKFGLVRIGFSGTEIISSNRSLIDLKQGKVIFKGKSVITKLVLQEEPSFWAIIFMRIEIVLYRVLIGLLLVITYF